MNQHEATTTSEIFTAERIKHFIKKNSYTFADGFKPFGHNLGCIDDRADELDSPEKIAIPGGALGVLLATLSSIKMLEMKYGTGIHINMNQLVSDVESITGISMHTDEKSIANGEMLPCAGCGHCAGILNTEALGPVFSNFIKSDYLPQMMNKGEKPAIYKGAHNASAVVVINDLKTGLRSKSDTGQVYVYNKGLHDKILTEVAEKIYDTELTSLVPKLTKTEMVQTLKDSAQAQLTKTVHALGADILPMYDEQGELMN